MRKQELMRQIHRNIMGLGISPNLAGFLYLVEGVRVQAELGPQGRICLKSLFYDIGDRYGVSPESVECGIRRAIMFAWNNNREVMQDTFFRLSAGLVTKRPTTVEFITHLGWAIVLKEVILSDTMDSVSGTRKGEVV